MKSIEQALKELEPLIGTDNIDFNKKLKQIRERFYSGEDIEKIDAFIRSGLKKTTSDLKDFNEETSLKKRLLEVSDIVSISYVAKTYFNKTRSWFYQRLNGNLVNGKPAKFTEEELFKLDSALKDVSKKIGSVSVME